MRMKTLSVTEVNGYIKKIFAGDLILNNLSIRGEISNLRLTTHSNTYFFSLKDANSLIRCVLFTDSAKDLNFIPTDGMDVIAHGRIALYGKNGSYSLIVDSIQPYGAGAYYQAFNTLKKKLEAEGLFDVSHKRKLTKYPEKIGVITSISGAVVHDILKVISQRYPFVDVDILPITVQGDSSAEGICDAFDIMNGREDVDLIILARGGGSAEDMWHFNEEKVARAIYNSKSPVISAVGHQTDYTISDFVADARAATPTQAAEMAVPDKNVLDENINKYKDSLIKNMQDILSKKDNQLDFTIKASPLSRPDMFFERYESRLNQLRQLLEYDMVHYMYKKQMNLSMFEKQLTALNPLDILKRGYAIIYDGDNNIVTDVKSIKTDNDIQVRLYNALINCRVEEVSDIE